MRACITGGSGFIGSHLAAALSAGGDEVLIIDRIKTNSDMKFISADISTKTINLQGIETLFHLAASTDVKKSMENPRESVENNVIATLNMLEACRKHDIKKIVFASSSAVYGNAQEIPIPEKAEIRPVSIYGATKAACEALIRSYNETYGLHAIILRYANIYGPGSRRGVIYDFMKKLTRDSRHLEILGDGKQSKPYLYIDDAIEATLLSAGLQGWNVINAGSEKETTAKRIAEMTVAAMGLGPVKFGFTGGSAGWPGDVSRYLLDLERIKSLGWKEKTELEDGIRKYFGWFRGAGHG